MPITDGISFEGFSDPIDVEQLYRDRCANVPNSAGIYVALRLFTGKPTFLSDSSGGWFKGKNPNYPPDVVCKNWIANAQVLYIGKAAGQGGLRARLRQLVDFGHGKPVGHRGGRLLWHLADGKELQVRWYVCPPAEADSLETAAIAKFKAVYGVRPFANLAK